MQLFRTESVKKDIWSRLYAESNLISAKHVQKQFYNIDLAKHKKHHQNLQLANRKKSAAFNKLRIFFQRVIKTNIGTLSSEARFRLAETCTDYANALSVAFMNEKQSYTLKKYNRNRQQVKNLKEMAKLLHSKNATQLVSDQGSETMNPWIRKSATRLSGLNFDKDQNKLKLVMPLSHPNELPNQWSYQ